MTRDCCEEPAGRSDLGVMIGATSRQIREAREDLRQQGNDEAIETIGELLWR